jgi:hypothetical protein
MLRTTREAARPSELAAAAPAGKPTHGSRMGRTAASGLVEWMGVTESAPGIPPSSLEVR